MALGSTEAIRPERMSRHWGLFVALGIALVILGLIALSATVVTTMASMFVFGGLLIVGGALQVGHALYEHDWRGRVLDLLTGVLFLVVGFLAIIHPVASAASFTLVLAIALVIRGAFAGVAAVAHRYPQWGWTVAYGIVSILLGVILWSSWPGISLWAIGFFVGIELVMDGVVVALVGLAARPRHRRREPREVRAPSEPLPAT